MFRFILGALLVATPAWADIVDPEVENCANAEEGSACELSDGTSGTCQPGECCRLDYSTDASTPPSVCTDCLRCSPAMPSAGGQMGTGGTPAGGQMGTGGAPAGGQMGTGGSPASGGMVADVPAGGEPAGSDDEDESGCSAGTTSEGGLGFVAALFGFLLAVRLRRSR